MNKFSNSLSELESDCRRAAEIPHWEEHMFRKDRFEMSAEEGEELGNILEKFNWTILELSEISMKIK